MKGKWQVKKLGEVVEFLDNLRKPVTASDRVPGPYPYYGANGQQDSVNDYIFDDELVLLAEDGGYFGSKTRPIAYRVSGKCWVNNHAHVLKPRDGQIDVDFLGYLLMFYDVTPYISGSTRKKLNKSQAEKIPLEIPPMLTQKKIVVKLDAVGKAQELNDLQISKTEELFKSIIQENILSNSNSWEQVKVRNLALMVGSGSTPRGGSSTYKLEGTPFIRSQNVLMLDLDLSDIVFIDEKTHKKMSRTKVYPQDVLLNITGASIGRVAIYPKSFEEANVNQHVCIIRVDVNKVVPEYLAIFLATESGQDQIWRIQAGGTRQGLNFEQVKDLKIFLPSVKEQQRVVEKLSAVQEHKKLLLKQKSLLRELFDSVLDKSMKGEL